MIYPTDKHSPAQEGIHRPSLLADFVSYYAVIQHKKAYTDLVY